VFKTSELPIPEDYPSTFMTTIEVIFVLIYDKTLASIWVQFDQPSIYTSLAHKIPPIHAQLAVS
jgi:hypothetical protein